MAGDGRREAAAMSPLAKLIRDKHRQRSYLEMSQDAARRGYRIAGQSIADVRADKHKGPLKQDMVDKLAAALGEPARLIRALDNERWGLSTPSAPSEWDRRREEVNSRRHLPEKERRELLAFIDRAQARAEAQHAEELGEVDRMIRLVAGE